jgi:hypothetical protein
MTDPVDPNLPFEYLRPYAPQPYAPQPYAGYPGYQSYPANEARPGAVVAASVLALVCSGFLIVAGLLLLLGASLTTMFDNADSNRDAFWLGLACIANLVSAALAILGAVMLLTRRAAGRAPFTAAAAIDTCAAIGWLTQGAGTLFFVAMCTGPLIVAVPLVWQRSVSGWLGAASSRAGYRQP